MESRGDVAVRVDANAEIGLGHLRRCMTLIRQLRADEFKVQIIGRYRFGKQIEALVEGVPISWLEDTDIAVKQRRAVETELGDAEGTLSVIGKHPDGFSWVIVDHYGLGQQWERLIRGAGHRVLAIDDFRSRGHCADILVSDTETPFDPSLNGCVAETHELVGTKFALIDEEFAFVREVPSQVDETARLLVSYGGSDPTDETRKALEAIRLLRRREEGRKWLGRVDVVVGHANRKTDDLIRFAEAIEDVVVHIAPRSLAPLLRETDLFLTAGGNSMLEALTMGKPCLVTLTRDNQGLMVAQLVERRAIVSLGEHSMVRPRDVAEAVAEVVSKYTQFADNIRARPLFDHLGARRISEAIQSKSRGGVSKSIGADIVRESG